MIPGARRDPTSGRCKAEGRVLLADSGVTRHDVRDGTDVTADVLTDGTASYTPGLSERRSGTSTFLVPGTKNVGAQTGATGAVSATRTYDAFGSVLASTGTFRGPYGYGGVYGYREDASGLDLLGHRLYDPAAGRFLSRDPARDGRNWYTYCGNDPVNGADPTGLPMIYGGIVASGQVPFVSGSVSGNLGFGNGGVQGQGNIGGGVGMGLAGGAGGQLGIDWTLPPPKPGLTTSKAIGITILCVTVELDTDNDFNPTGASIGLAKGEGGSVYVEERGTYTTPRLDGPLPSLPSDEGTNRFDREMESAVKQWTTR